MTYTYKGVDYPLFTGTKGGQYILVNNKKVYIKKKVKKVLARNLVPAKLHRYICYYEIRNSDGEFEDDFKEWCDAYSEAEARSEFRDRYRNANRYRIIQIIEEKD